MAEAMQRIETLVARFESSPDESVREDARELVGTLMDFHSEALRKLVEAFVGKAGPGELERLASDPMISGVLLLYDLHPAGLEQRIHQALEQVRPSLKAHQGDVELLSIQDGVVELRLQGTCNGCPSSKTTFRNLIEEAILGLAPEVQSIQVEGMAGT